MKIAGVQFDVRLGKPAENLQRMTSFLQQTAREGASLTVFPECAVTGYCFESADEARPFAESIPGPATEALTRCCRQSGVYAVFGMLEDDGQYLYNAAVLVGPAGVVGAYRKIHLPYLGIDMYTRHGDRAPSVH